MKNIRAAILAICLGTLGSIGAIAQSQNTAYGTGALNTNGGNDNSAFGYNSLYNNGGYLNSAFGDGALSSNTSGGQNVAFGVEALGGNNTGGSNTAVGMQALSANGSGNYNVGVGYNALEENDGSDNVAIGYGSLFNNRAGGYNVAIGTGAGASIGASGGNQSYNIDIANQGTTTDSGTVRIGTSGQQTSFYVAGVYGVDISSPVQVYVNSNGQLGVVNSSIRYKEDVHDMADASSAILRLRPVTYRYKQAYADGSRPIDYGLIAEEVAKVYPDLVVRNASGEIQTVQYQKLTPMLLNELQKQHRALDQMAKTLEEQQQTIQLLKTQQTQTVQLLERRLAALEGQTSGLRLESKLDTK